MPLGKDVKYRFKGSGRKRVRLALKNGTVVEKTKWPAGGSKGRSKRVK
jgi:hypothetical protein